MALAIRTRSLSASVMPGPMSGPPGPGQAPASDHVKTILGGSISHSLLCHQRVGDQKPTPQKEVAFDNPSLTCNWEAQGSRGWAGTAPPAVTRNQRGCPWNAPEGEGAQALGSN